MLTTTLLTLRDKGACKRGYDLIAAHVGADFTGDIPLETILEVNGLQDCIWALRASNGGLETSQEFAIRLAITVYKEPQWTSWANNWLSGVDRSTTSAAYADDAADTAYADAADTAAAASASTAAAASASAAYATSASAAYAAAIAAASATATASASASAILRALITRGSN